jgi:hypothetical protein
MAYGHFNQWRNCWTFTCAGCGQEFEAPDYVSPLDNLDCCSAECDAIVEARPAPICNNCESEIQEDGTCQCKPVLP